MAKKHTQHSTTLEGDRITWTLETVKNGGGDTMFEIAKDFRKNGRAINDSEGEALLARHGIPKDN